MIATIGGGEVIDTDNHLPNLTGFVSKESPHPIAHGSFGDVWKCTYTASNRLEASMLHIWLIDVAGDDSRDRVTQRLLGDFRARKQLHHENLLPLLGFSHEFGLLPAMISPWIHNGSLTTYLEHHFTELTIKQKLLIVSYFSEVLLHHVHSKGVVHGDLTANNILIDSDRNAHVADHGILTMCSELSGTSYIRSNVRWAAPELFEVPESEESLTPQPASDIYSFGCIMLQVMTGRPPYADVRSDHQVIVLILKGKKPTRPSSPHDADSFWDFIEKCWGDIGRRPSAVDVLNFLGSNRVTALVKQTEN
ncbi:kinase-like domain-containing protein [Suillus tomentosus]|nr:kinase-like domain-containing protein [Suillus tomentosus]